jgi:hypothetical protein
MDTLSVSVQRIGQGTCPAPLQFGGRRASAALSVWAFRELHHHARQFPPAVGGMHNIVPSDQVFVSYQFWIQCFRAVQRCTSVHYAKCCCREMSILRSLTHCLIRGYCYYLLVGTTSLKVSNNFTSPSGSFVSCCWEPSSGVWKVVPQHGLSDFFRVRSTGFHNWSLVLCSRAWLVSFVIVFWYFLF